MVIHCSGKGIFIIFAKNYYMKKILLLLVCNILTICLFAQNQPLTTLTLSNGMNVVLCEDHNQPQIYGAVCVHVGSKNDPEDNTGMAHYLEHLMFKGTDRIGTLDWEKERVYLDSIDLLYDQLHGTTDLQQREDLLMHINQLSNQATQYAIPNEVDVILDKMGGDNVNAFTSNDVTCYHNCFPSNQLEKWLTVYTERFRRPVFRLFQSELEAVYEEYNMYHDNPLAVFMEDAVEMACGGHPYGRPVIGYPQHLKNPQTSAMQKFFNTYYHPCNMTLVLVGDFNAEGLKPLLERTIGQLHNEAPGVDKQLAYRTERMDTRLHSSLPTPSGQQVFTMRETPVKMGVIGFLTVGADHEDALYLDIMGRLLNNNSSTGLIDQLNNENKLLMAYSFNYSLLEEGLFAFMYVPKIIGQSHEQAESLIFAAIDSLRKGQFSDELFKAVQMEYLTEYLTEMETLESKFYTVLGIVTDQKDPGLYLKTQDIIRNLTKEELIKKAAHYFSDNCLIVRSSMGVKNQEKLNKPTWSPVVAQNTDKESEYAQKIAEMPAKEMKPFTLDIQKTVKETDINPAFTLYSTHNPVNDIFTLTIVYNYGTLNDKRLDNAISYIEQQGTKQQSFNEFQMALQQIGASLEISANTEQTTISISGFDNQIKEVIQLCSEKILAPANDESKLATLINEELSAQKMMKKDASAWGRALFYYAIYGENSPEINKMTLKELKKVSGEELLSVFSEVLKYDGHVNYVGNHAPDMVAELLRKSLLPEDKKWEKGEQKVAPLVKYDKPTILMVSNKSFLQSNIYFYLQAQPVKEMQQRMVCHAYNEYMGGSMAGVIFQEIRELRSLGYSAHGRYDYDWLNRRPGMIWGFLGTQADKTLEGCEEMGKLLTKFPEKPEKFETAKESAIKKMESSSTHFRDIPQQVYRWRAQQINEDPLPKQIDYLHSITYEEVKKFYEKSTSGSPMVITVAGDKKRMNLQQLGDQYNIIEVKAKEIMR